MLPMDCQEFSKRGGEVPVNSGLPGLSAGWREMQVMDESVRSQIETYLSHLNGLIRRGGQVREMLTD